MKDSKLLVISYHFPPYWTTGVIRIAKMTRHFARLGWRVTVLTSRRYFIPKALLTEEDYDRAVDIRRRPLALPDLYQALMRVLRPPETQDPSPAQKTTLTGPASIQKAHTYQTIYRPSFKKRIESFIFPIDIYILWLPWACFFGWIYLRRHRDVRRLWISGPPFSQLLAGVFLKKCFRDLCFVADFRDHWIEDMNRLYPTRYHRRIDEWAERQVLRSADSLVFVSEIHHQQSLTKGVAPSHASIIYNGFDEEDFLPKAKTEQMPPFKVAYFGNIGEGRNIGYLLEALSDCIRTKQIPRSEVQFVIYGHTHAYFKDLAHQRDLDDIVLFEKPIPYKQALEQMTRTAVLLLIIDHDEFTSCYPTKFFEYLYARRPILVIGPSRGAGSYVEKNKIGVCVAEDDSDSIKKALIRFYARFKAGDLREHQVDISGFSRSHLVREMAAVFENSCTN